MDYAISQSKRQQPCKEDLLSLMGDEIIHHILSFLDIKKAIQTSVLSKRWEFLWTTMPTLSFDYGHLRFPNRVVSFIDRTLMYYRGSRIGKLNLKVYSVDVEEFNSQINSWVSFAISRRVEDFSFNLFDNANPNSTPDYYLISRFIYNHSYFVNLNLIGCVLPQTSCVSWKLLKRLHLSFNNIAKESLPLQSILRGSPLLEYLAIDNCIVEKGIASASLTTLKLVNVDVDDMVGCSSVVNIYAPNLLYLTLSEDMLYEKCRLINVASLLEASLNNMDTRSIYLLLNHQDFVKIEYQDHMKELIEQLSHVPKISLGMWCLQIIAMRELEGLILPPLKWQTLTLDIMLMNCCVPAILHLFQRLPDLRNLTINMKQYKKGIQRREDEWIFGPFNLEKGEAWISRMTTINCSMLHLKSIEINGTRSCLRSKVGKIIVDFLIRTSNEQGKVVVIRECQ